MPRSYFLGDLISGMMGGLAILPFAIDFSTYADGALVPPLSGPTWAILTENAYNTPGHGSNLFASGKGTFDTTIESWTKYNNNLVTSDAGKLKIEYVDGTNGAYFYFKQTASDLSANLTVGKVYRLEVDAYVSAGADVNMVISDGASNTSSFHITNVAPVTYHITFRARSTTGCLKNFSGFGAGEICRLDNLKLYQLNDVDLFASVNLGVNPSVFVMKTFPIVAFGGAVGVRMADTAAGITNSLTVYYDKNRQRVVTGQFLAGVWSEIAAGTGVAAYSIGASVELIRVDATTFRVKYNNIQVGTDFTVNNAANLGSYFGLFSTEEDSSAPAFFIGQSVTARTVVYLGNSIMDGASASAYELTSYRAITRSSLDHSYGSSEITHYNAGVGGTDSWYALIRLAVDVIAKNPDLILIEFVNDTNSVLSKTCEEALFRRLRTQLPNVKIVFLALPTITSNALNDATNSKSTTIANWLALCSLYGVEVVDWTGVSKALVDAGTYTCAEIWYDDKHLLDLGHSLAAAFLKPTLTDGILTEAAQFTGALPDRIYDNGAKEATPIIRNAIDNNGETGVWATVATTARQSNTALSTMTFTGTFSSFGLDGTRQVGSLSWNIDGGAWVTMDGNVELGYPLNLWNDAVAGAHTVTVRVNSGTVRINRFLAI